MGLSGQPSSEYDAIYGYSHQAIAEWLRWNPQLAAEREVLILRAKNRRDELFGKRGAR